MSTPTAAPDWRARFAAARVARLATASAGGVPHVVPVTFAVRDDAIVTAVDAKPKRTRALKRVANIRANPRVSLLVDEYSDDWSRLWWARADGVASVLDGGDLHDRMLRLLAERYEQYRSSQPAGPVIVVAVERWSGWSAQTAPNVPDRSL
jgi:PPOX class probable F420-dependent enzyme